MPTYRPPNCVFARTPKHRSVGSGSVMRKPTNRRSGPRPLSTAFIRAGGGTRRPLPQGSRGADKRLPPTFRRGSRPLPQGSRGADKRLPPTFRRGSRPLPQGSRGADKRLPPTFRRGSRPLPMASIRTSISACRSPAARAATRGGVGDAHGGVGVQPDADTFRPVIRSVRARVSRTEHFLCSLLFRGLQLRLGQQSTRGPRRHSKT
jgi:hypothetical protein